MSVFNGKWICPQEFACRSPINVFHHEGESDITPHPNELKNLHIHFLAELALSEHPKTALLRVSADDYYKLRINGEFVCQGPSPAYHFRYSWNEIDISPFLRIGENRFDFEVYYQGLINRVWCSGDLRCGMICDIICDGAPVLTSGSGFEYYISRRWNCKRVFGYDTQFAEEYDATVAEPVPRPVHVNGNADYVFDKAPDELLEVYEAEPETKKVLPNGGLLCDFGSEITGTVNLVCEGKAGERIDIFFGEECDNSELEVMYLTRSGCDYHDAFIIGEEKTFRGYDYKAFRYVSFMPTSGAKILGVSASVRHAKFPENVLDIVTENESLYKVFDICRRGVMLGAQEVFVDCPSREKGQYSGDLLVTGESYFWLTGYTKMLRRAVQSFMDSAFIDKGLMAVAPCSHMQEIADYSLQFPYLARRLYDFSGDREFLQECLKTCENIIEYFKHFAAEDGLLQSVPKWNLVDWPENLRDGYEMSEKHNVINAWYLCAVRETENICDILEIQHSNSFDSLKDSFNKVFYREYTGLYADNPDSDHSALHSNVLPLFAGIVPKKNIPRIAGFIEDKGLCCGVYFAYFLLKALCMAGRYDSVYRLITSRGKNSWYNMIREGGTACFEAWGKEQKWNTSLCHPWASGPISIIAELCGLRAKKGKVFQERNMMPDGTVLNIGENRY